MKSTNREIGLLALAILCISIFKVGCLKESDKDGIVQQYQNPLGQFSLGNAGQALAAKGNHVIIDYDEWGGDVHGLTLVDISSAVAPAAVSSLDLPGSVMQLRWMRDYVYALQLVYIEGDNGGWAGRVSEISVLSGEMHIEREWNTTDYPHDILVKDSGLYVSTEAGVHVINLDGWTAETLLTVEQGIPGFLASAGNRLYLCGQSLGLVTYDISDPAAPVQLGFAPMDTDFSPQIAARENLVVVSLASEGLLVLDTSNPNEVQSLGTVDVEGGAGPMILEDDFGCLAGGDSGVYQIDGSSIDDFTVLGLCELNHYVNAVAVTDSYVIGSGIEKGFSICERLQ